MKRVIAGIVLVSAAAIGLSACSTEARAERKGKEFGDQICKAKNADSADEAQRHIRKAQDKADDLSRFTGRDINEDLRDIDRNLDQMARGNATEQDVNAIVRSVQQAKSDASGSAEAAFDGMLEGLADCD